MDPQWDHPTITTSLHYGHSFNSVPPGYVKVSQLEFLKLGFQVSTLIRLTQPQKISDRAGIGCHLVTLKS